MFGAVSQGLGTASDLIPEEATVQVKKVNSFHVGHNVALHADNVKMMFAGDLFYVLALFCSKLSVCLFFRRLSASTRRTLVPDAFTCACAVLSIVSMLLVGPRQRLTEPWVQPTFSHSTVGDTSAKNDPGPWLTHTCSYNAGLQSKHLPY